MEGLSTPEVQDLMGGISRVSAWRLLKKVDDDEGNKSQAYVRGKIKHHHPQVIKKMLVDYGFIFPTNEVLTFACLKGGVGKTTLSICTAYRLAKLGAKVLLIDLDKQSNSTSTVTQREGQTVTFLDVVTERATFQQAIHKTCFGFDLIPSNLKIAEIDQLLTSHKIPHHRYIRDFLENLTEQYNYIIIDTSADLSSSVYVSMLASNKVVIPVTLEQYAIDGLVMDMKVLDEIKVKFKKDKIDPSVFIVLNKVDPREKSAFDFLPDILKFTNQAKIIQSTISVKSELKKIAKHGFDSLKNERKTFGDVDSFVREIIGLSIKKQKNQEE